MEAKELRIGNLVNAEKSNCFFSQGIYEVSIDTFEIIQHFKGIEDLQPIHITEDWLLKFGFKQDSDLKNSLVKNAIWFNKVNMEATYFSQKLRKINYVHQLQNLYFALTGEDLEINQ